MSSQKTAIVTGATKGIGRQIATQLAEAGYKVVASGRNTKELDELTKATGCIGIPCALENSDDVLAFYGKAREALGGRIDVLVNNAGYSNANQKIKVKDETVENFDTQIAINVRAPFILCREAMKEMSERKDGHIVNIVSTVALQKQANFGVYTASKFAFDGLTGVLQKEGRENNVKVTAVYPGGTDTNIRPEARPQYMRPESVAKVVVQCITAPPEVVMDQIVFRPMAEANF